MFIASLHDPGSLIPIKTLANDAWGCRDSGLSESSNQNTMLWIFFAHDFGHTIPVYLRYNVEHSSEFRLG